MMPPTHRQCVTNSSPPVSISSPNVFFRLPFPLPHPAPPRVPLPPAAFHVRTPPLVEVPPSISSSAPALGRVPLPPPAFHFRTPPRVEVPPSISSSAPALGRVP